MVEPESALGLNVIRWGCQPRSSQCALLVGARGVSGRASDVGFNVYHRRGREYSLPPDCQDLPGLDIKQHVSSGTCIAPLLALLVFSLDIRRPRSFGRSLVMK